MNTSSTEIYLKNIGGDICCPFFDKFGSLHIVFSDSGEIAVVRGDDVKVVHSTNGQTSSALYDESGMLYITDYAHSAVLMAHKNASNNEGKRDFILGSQEVIVGFYEDRPLRGPSSIAIDKFGNIVFTDSGPLGDTGLHSPKGSVFIVSAGVSGQLLKPIVFEKLAFPSAVVFSPDSKFM
jgi:sugar lactone lactonase YvrE